MYAAFLLLFAAEATRFLTGVDLYKSGRYDDALAALKESAKVGESAPERSFYLGLCEVKRGEWTKASAHFDAYSSTNPGDARGWSWLAQARLFARQFDEARTAIVRALAIDAMSSEAHRVLGEIEFQRRDYESAYRAWVRANQLDPADARTIYYLGRLFFEADFTNEAASWLRESLRLKPDDFAAMTYLALCAERMGMEDTASKLYQAAILESRKQKKPYSWAFVSYGKLLRQQGKNAEALQLLEEAARICPDAHVLVALGQALTSEQQRQRAEEILKRAVALDPSISEAHYRLSLLLRSSGQVEEAALEMRRFEEAKRIEQQNAAKIIAIRKPTK